MPIRYKAQIGKSTRVTPVIKSSRDRARDVGQVVAWVPGSKNEGKDSLGKSFRDMYDRAEEDSQLLKVVNEFAKVCGLTVSFSGGRHGAH